jgi:hypothetical protein
VVIDPGELAAKEAHVLWEVQRRITSGPMGAWASLVVATWWMLREVELNHLTCGAVFVRVDRSMGELRLGATKTDIEGRGKRRCFMCVCGKGDLPACLCPSCVLTDHLATRTAAGAEPEDPLFCTPGGHAPTALGTIMVWQAIAAESPKYSDEGVASTDWRVTGHTARRSGAQWLIRRGLELWQVQYIGRWGSSTVELYIAAVMAERRAELAALAARPRATAGALAWAAPESGDAPGERDSTAYWEIKSELTSMLGKLKDVDAVVVELKELATAGWRATAAKLSDSELNDLVLEATAAKPGIEVGKPAYVLNRVTGVAHRVSVERLRASCVSGWRSECGWAFGKGSGVLLGGTAPAPLCQRRGCFGAFGLASDGSSSGDSS